MENGKHSNGSKIDGSSDSVNENLDRDIVSLEELDLQEDEKYFYYFLSVNFLFYKGTKNR